MNKQEFVIKADDITAEITKKSDLTRTEVIMNINGVAFRIIWDNRYHITMVVPKSVVVERYTDGDYVRE